MMIRQTLALSAAATALAACATMPPPRLTPPPGPCPATVDLATAISLDAPRNRNGSREMLEFSGETACWDPEDDRGPTPYRLVRLPQNDGQRLLTVGSALEAGRVFALDVELLDANGRTTRVFGPEDQQIVGALRAVQIRPRDEDAYVLVTANSGLIGSAIERVSLGTQTSYTSTGYAVVSYSTGADEAGQHAFSYDGNVVVQLQDAP